MVLFEQIRGVDILSKITNFANLPQMLFILYEINFFLIYLIAIFNG